MAGGPRASVGPVVGAALTALVALAVHGRTAWFGLTGLDDRDLVVDDAGFLAAPGSALHAFGRSYLHVVDPSHAYFRPIVTASLALDAKLTGALGAGPGTYVAYHATNVVLYAAASALFFLLLLELAMPAWAALLGGTAFAVHPALASAVAWIPGRNDAMLAVFALAGWLALARDGTCPRTGFVARSLGWKAAHFIALVLAMLTKETAAALPVVYAAHAAWTWPAEPDRRRRALRLLPYAIGWMGALAGFVAIHVRAAPAIPWTLESTRVLVASAGKVLLVGSPAAIASPEDMSAALGLAAIGAAVAGSALVGGVRRRIVGLGAVAFVATLAPTLVVAGGAALGCRLALPACGGLLVATEIMRAAVEARPLERARAAVAGGAVVVTALALVTAGFESSFRDPRAFAAEAVDDSPHSPLAHVCLGSVLQSEGALDRAAAEYRTALALGPAEIAHNNLGVLAMASGRWDEAERELRGEIALQPSYGRAYRNLAVVLRHEGRLDEAQAAQARADALSAP